MGFLINQNKLKRNKVMRRKPTNFRSNRGIVCRASYITEILPNGAWKGKTCFLLGGGPSLKDFDFNLIKNEITIGVNKSFIKFPTTVNYAMDERFYNMVTGTQKIEWKELHQQWLLYSGIKVFLRRGRKVKFDKSVYVINNLGRKALSFDLDAGIWSGNNSGFGALSLAVGLGCKRIGLLGYDLKVRQKQGGVETHWHGGYGLGRTPTFQKKLDKFRVCFEEFAPAISKEGVEVVNLNKDSALECFSKDSIENFLK